MIVSPATALGGCAPNSARRRFKKAAGDAARHDTARSPAHWRKESAFGRRQSVGTFNNRARRNPHRSNRFSQFLIAHPLCHRWRSRRAGVAIVVVISERAWLPVTRLDSVVCPARIQIQPPCLPCPRARLIMRGDIWIIASMKTVSRRNFLKRAGAFAGGLVAVPNLLPLSALGRGGAVAPS